MNNASAFNSRGGRSHHPHPYRPSTWRAIARPQVHPSPPRPRPTMFFYILSLIYSQNGLTRKFRHYLPCSHNVTYFSINELNKRHLYAAGCECALCPFCEETIVYHSHLNVFHCPQTAYCPKISKIPSVQVEGRFEHFCGSHQAVVPHPLDLNSIRNLPISFNSPTQFAYYSNIPNDSVSLVNCLYARHRPEEANAHIPEMGVHAPSGSQGPPTVTVPVTRHSSITVTYPLLNTALTSAPPMIDLTVPPPTPERPRSCDLDSDNLQIVEPTEVEFSEAALNLSLRKLEDESQARRSP